MIKYLELTAPTTSAFRQAKIVSIECNEGDRVSEGSTLFRVKSGEQEIDLPSTRAGRVVEMIATLGENITLSTALLLLETEVDGSTATPPITPVNEEAIKDNSFSADTSTASKASGKNKKLSKRAQKKADKKVIQTEQKSDKNDQQSLDLLAENFQLTQEVAPQPQPKPKQKPNTSAQSQTMSSNSTIEVTVPDIGADSAKVIEILVNVGDTVAAEDALITLESDKASMDVPSTHGGVISAINVAIDQDVSEGSIIIELQAPASGESSSTAEPASASADGEAVLTEQRAEKSAEQKETDEASPNKHSNLAPAQEIEVVIPDIGGDSAKVIEILVSVGDKINVEDALVTLESDKASMEVPSSVAGVISSIEVQLDQDVSEGVVVVKVLAGQVSPAPSKPAANLTQTDSAAASSQAAQVKQKSPAPAKTQSKQDSAVALPTKEKSHASPSIRRFARELGVGLSAVNGSGRKGRITEDDVKGYVKGVISSDSSSAPTASSGTGIPAIPQQDFSKFGEIEVQPLNKIKRLTATNLHRSWLNVPHVTHNDEANINDLESFRKQLNAESAKQPNGVKLSPLAFVVKAVVHGLRHYPQFNSSLDATGENLILKKYCNIGIAVETPNGLVVPVLRDADKKSISDIAQEMGALAAKARDKKLTMADMSGACFTISSLGGIGGTGFTPIVNAPEVAILGVSRSKIAPVWNGQEFEPGMMLPLSLSYDHRVIDGAEAARFTRHVAAALEDVRRLTI